MRYNYNRNLGDLTPDQVNGILQGLWSAAQQIFPTQSAEAVAWVQQQALQYGIQQVNIGVTAALNNPIVLILIGALVYKFVLK